MTQYYLKTDGNDGDNGLDWDHAWQTVAHAQVTISPYDKVYIRVGSYPETSTFIFNPPEGTEWMAEDYPLNIPHLFNLGGYDNTFVVTNNNIKISGCKVGTFVSPWIELNCTGFWFSSCELACWLQGAAINPKFESCWIDTSEMCVIDFQSPSAATGIYWNLGGWQVNAGGYCTISGTGHDFQYLISGVNITTNFKCADITINCIQIDGTVELWGSSGNTFTNSKYYGAALLHIVKHASADGQQTIHNFEYPDLPILKTTVDAGASLTIIQDDRGFLETSNNLRTTITTSNSQLVVTGAASNVTFTKRPLLITTNGDISVLVDTWSVAGDKNKAWKVEATGARTITFQLGDMIPNTKYDLKVGGVKVSDATSNGSGVVTFSPYSGSFSEKEFGAEKSPEVTFIPLIIIT